MTSVSLADAIINLVRDITPGLFALISIICYIAGAIVFVQGLTRLLRHSQDRYQTPSAAGTAACFVLCLILIMLPRWLDAGGETLFGAGARPSEIALSYGVGTGGNYDELLAAIVTIVRFVGLIAFIRGGFVARAAADGRHEATAGRAAAHLVAGLAAWHIVPVIDAVQTSLGIRIVGVS